MNLRDDAISIFKAGLNAVHPQKLMSETLHVGNEYISIDGVAYPFDSYDNLYVIGAGKAAAAMAQGAEKTLKNLITDGLVVTKHQHALPTNKIKVLEAGHPIPDKDGLDAMEELLELLKKIKESDLVICLISGGASALWCDVPKEFSLEDLQETIELLLKSGADIHEMNTVRKHLSLIKGGQLLRYTNKAKVISLILSDVPGDDLSVIASGPTHADSSTFSQALQVLNTYKLKDKIPNSVLSYLQKGEKEQIAETIKPNSELLENCRNILIGTNHLALEASKQKAEELGYNTHLNERLVIGNTEIEAIQFCKNLFQKKQKRPLCLLQGGETTLKVKGNGKGGRNQHFALAAAQYLKDKYIVESPFCLLSGGSDGTDGPTNAAGGIIDINTFRTAMHKKADPFPYLTEFDAYHFLKETDSLLLTGPTQTNVMDIMIGLVKE